MGRDVKLARTDEECINFCQTINNEYPWKKATTKSDQTQSTAARSNWWWPSGLVIWSGFLLKYSAKTWTPCPPKSSCNKQIESTKDRPRKKKRKEIYNLCLHFSFHRDLLTFLCVSPSQSEDTIKSMSHCISISILSFSSVLVLAFWSMPRASIIYQLMMRILGMMRIQHGLSCFCRNVPSPHSPTIWLIAPWSTRSWFSTSSPTDTILRSNLRQYRIWARLLPRPPLPWKLLPWPP